MLLNIGTYFYGLDVYFELPQMNIVLPYRQFFFKNIFFLIIFRMSRIGKRKRKIIGKYDYVYATRKLRKMLDFEEKSKKR